MAKPNLNGPKQFPKIVTVTDVDGEDCEIEFSMIYRTRSEFAALADEHLAGIHAHIATQEAAQIEAATAAAKKKKAKDAGPKTMVEAYAEADSMSADYALKIVDGWDLDDPLNKASLIRLENRFPGSLSRIAIVYREAVSEARTKN